MSNRKLYYDLTRPSFISALVNLNAALPKKNKSDFRGCLEQQDTYTLHRPARKRSLRNPYKVNYVIVVWECVLLDVHSFAKYKDMHRYIQ